MGCEPLGGGWKRVEKMGVGWGVWSKLIVGTNRVGGGGLYVWTSQYLMASRS